MCHRALHAPRSRFQRVQAQRGAGSRKAVGKRPQDAPAHLRHPCNRCTIKRVSLTPGAAGRARALLAGLVGVEGEGVCTKAGGLRTTPACVAHGDAGCAALRVWVAGRAAGGSMANAQAHPSPCPDCRSCSLRCKQLWATVAWDRAATQLEGMLRGQYREFPAAADDDAPPACLPAWRKSSNLLPLAVVPLPVYAASN